MAEKFARPDAAVAEIARRQHGVATIRQLRSAGLSDDAVLGRVRAGRLHRLHQGVYAVGHLPFSREIRWMAAILAGGEIGGKAGEGRTGTVGVLDYWGAALSHRSAAELWGLLPAGGGWIDISVPGYGGRARRRGIRVHRSISLVPATVTLCSGIPATTPARTLVDLRRASSVVRLSGRQVADEPGNVAAVLRGCLESRRR